MIESFQAMTFAAFYPRSPLSADLQREPLFRDIG